MIDVMLLNVLDITQEDLHAHTSPTTEEKLCSNPLQRTFELLGEILIQRSREDMERQTERVKMAREAKAARAKQLSSDEKTDSAADETKNIAEPRLPSALPSTPQKRDFSGTSFGPRSTEGTPITLIKPEPNIQDLQNTLVRDVLRAIYGSPYIRVPWARGRQNMRLSYEPYNLPLTRHLP